MRMRSLHVTIKNGRTERARSSGQSASDSNVSSDGEDSGEDASESSSRTSAEPESLLSQLKGADRSGLCRKRSVAVNQSRKQHS